MSLSYNTSERLIYGPYHDGLSERYADPIAVHRKLVMVLDEDPNHFIRQLKSEVPSIKVRAEIELAAAAVGAFDLLPFDPSSGTGSTQDEALAILYDYIGWREKNAKRDAT